LVRRPLERILDVFLTDGRGVPSACAFDERLQVGLAEMVVRDGDGGVVAHRAPPL
jgi:hypothetical protein